METMKADATKPKAEPRKMTGDPLVDGIPVAELCFCVPGGRDLTLKHQSVNGGISKLRAKEGLEITYLHKLRFYRVVENRKGTPTTTLMIPETWATFEPLE